MYDTQKELEDEILYYNEHAKPYQKYNKYTFETYKDDNREKAKYKYCSQKQMPAYLMISIANSMHELRKDVDNEGNVYYRRQKKDKKFLGLDVWENQYTLLKAKFGFNTWGAKWSLVVAGSPVVNAIEYPHYLESYYTLTKELSTLNFR